MELPPPPRSKTIIKRRVSFFLSGLVFVFCGFLLTACDIFGRPDNDGADTYTVTIGTLTNANGNTITANPISGPEGIEITLTVSEDNGYRLKAGTLKYNSTAVNETTRKFNLPAENVTITAEWESALIINESYRGTYSIGEGDINALKLTETTAIAGETTHAGIYTVEGGGTYVYFYKDRTKIGVSAQSLTGGIQLFFGTAADSNTLNTGWGASPELDLSDLGASPFNAAVYRFPSVPDSDNERIAGIWALEGGNGPPYLRFNLSDNTASAPYGHQIGTYSLKGNSSGRAHTFYLYDE